MNHDIGRKPKLEGRVLVVDDDDQVIRVYQRVLQGLGCVVETATNGSEALDHVRGSSFDLIVSDIAMEGMSGTQFLRAVRERQLDVPVILVTGSPGLESAIEAVNYRAFRYLTKPIAIESFTQAVRSAIQANLIARVQAEHLPLAEACRRVVASTCQGSEWDLAAIWMPNESGEMRCTETWARPGCEVALFEASTPDVRPDRAMRDKAHVEGASDWSVDISVSSNFLGAPRVVAAGFVSGFAVPIRAENEVLAVMEFFSRQRREPDHVLMDLFATASARLAADVLRERADLRVARAETAQRTISITLNAIMECAPAFILAVDLGGRIQFINRVLPQHKLEDVIGSDWLLYVPPAEYEEHRERLRRVLATGLAETYETSVLGDRGAQHFFSTRIGPLRDSDKIVGAVIIANEITELRRTRDEIADAQRLASVGTMAAGVAHEVNTPIQFVNDSVHFLRDATQDFFSLMGQLRHVRQLAADGAPTVALEEAIARTVATEDETDFPYLTENVPQAFERCIDGLERIKTIVRSMKEFAHPAQHDMAPIDLNRAVQSTLTVARGEYKYVADLDLDLGEVPPVTCHVNDINQVVLNLVVNAAHAIGDALKGTEAKGIIGVRTRRDGEYALISVSDTGVGIPPEVAPRIFEPFFTTKEVGKGTGQGLALAWTVVKEKHGGKLTFETKVGRGTTFFVRLPIAGKAAGSAARSAARSPAA